MLPFLFTLETMPNACIPKRYMRYTLVFCQQGKLVIHVDDQAFTLRANDVITITSGQVHCFSEIGDASARILEFTVDFMCKTDNDIELIFENGLFCHFDKNEVISLGEQTPVAGWLRSIGKELYTQPYQHATSIHSYMELILVEINRTRVASGYEIWKPEALFLRFIEQVRAHFSEGLPLSKHADLLGTTELKLNELAKKYTGKTAQMVIYGLTTSEARRMLRYGNHSIKEVAFLLGFNDPFYFSNFFKKHTGVSPKVYKQQLAV